MQNFAFKFGLECDIKVTSDGKLEISIYNEQHELVGNKCFTLEEIFQCPQDCIMLDTGKVGLSLLSLTGRTFSELNSKGIDNLKSLREFPKEKLSPSTLSEADWVFEELKKAQYKKTADTPVKPDEPTQDPLPQKEQGDTDTVEKEALTVGSAKNTDDPSKILLKDFLKRESKRKTRRGLKKETVLDILRVAQEHQITTLAQALDKPRTFWDFQLGVTPALRFSHNINGAGYSFRRKNPHEEKLISADSEKIGLETTLQEMVELSRHVNMIRKMKKEDVKSFEYHEIKTIQDIQRFSPKQLRALFAGDENVVYELCARASSSLATLNRPLKNHELTKVAPETSLQTLLSKIHLIEMKDMLSQDDIEQILKHFPDATLQSLAEIPPGGWSTTLAFGEAFENRVRNTLWYFFVTDVPNKEPLKIEKKVKSLPPDTINATL